MLQTPQLCPVCVVNAQCLCCCVRQLGGWRCMRRRRPRQLVALWLWSLAAVVNLWAVAHSAATAVQCLCTHSLLSLKMRRTTYPVTSSPGPVPSAAAWSDTLSYICQSIYLSIERLSIYPPVCPSVFFFLSTVQTILIWICPDTCSLNCTSRPENLLQLTQLNLFCKLIFRWKIDGDYLECLVFGDTLKDK